MVISQAYFITLRKEITLKWLLVNTCLKELRVSVDLLWNSYKSGKIKKSVIKDRTDQSIFTNIWSTICSSLATFLTLNNNNNSLQKKWYISHLYNLHLCKAEVIYKPTPTNATLSSHYIN
jgi:hypothetical protein